MARRDELTNKGTRTGNTRSKALNHSRRTWRLNLQTVSVKDGTKTKRVKVSVRTLKRLKKNNQLA